MSIKQLVKHDALSIIRSPLTYLALSLTLVITIFIVYLFMVSFDEISGDMILTIFSWFLGTVGLLFVVRTLTRDIIQGTMELYLNTRTNRNKYYYSKMLSTILISILFSIICIVMSFITQVTVAEEYVSNLEYARLTGVYLLYFVFFGSLLFLIAMSIKNSAVTYSIAVFISLVVPLISAFLPLIPEYGEKIQNILEYLPFVFLVDKIYEGDFTLTVSQIIISVVSIIIIGIINIIYISKKDI